MIDLKKGDVIFGGLPGQSAYYTDLQTILESQGDKAELGRILQIRPHSIFGYRPNIAQYEVLQDIRIPSDVALNNPNFGVGMGRQFFLSNFSNSLRLVNEFDVEEFYDQQLMSTYKFGR